MSRYAFGVDIGGTTVKMGLFDESVNLLDKWEIPTRTEDNGSAVLSDVAASITEKITQKNIAAADIAGVGVGAPGPVDDDGNIYGAVNLGWGTLNIPEKLGNYFDFAVKAGNDASVAAFGEMCKGSGSNYSSLVAVTLGTGVGGGVIVNGKLLMGARGGAGEIGHIHINDEESEACGCGNFGCLEEYASATGLVRLARRRLEKDNTPSVLRDQELSAKSVFDAVKAGDAVADEIASEFGDYLGKGLAIVASIMNPEAFVIGGGVSGAGEILFHYIEPAFHKYVFPPCAGVDFVLASLGNDAGIYGAAALILQRGGNDDQ